MREGMREPPGVVPKIHSVEDAQEDARPTKGEGSPAAPHAHTEHRAVFYCTHVCSHTHIDIGHTMRELLKTLIMTDMFYVNVMT